MSWSTEVIQGATFETICSSCNNNTGSWYNPAYVQFSQDCQQFARPENAGQICRFEVSVHRQRVVKQTLTSLLVTSQPGLSTRYPGLRALVLGKANHQPIAPLQLWLYLRANPGADFTGITIAFEHERRKGNLAVGFSFWPLGWIMTIGEVTVDGTANVSTWTELGYHDKRAVVVEVPCQWALSPHLGDFSGPDEFPAEP